MEFVRMGIIGVGNMGSGHLSNIVGGKCPEIKVTAVCDINPDRLAWAREKAGPDIACFENAIEMLDSGLIDACIIAVPHYSHPMYVIECLKRDIHVMCEKPAGVYTKAVRAMNEAAAHSKAKFGMMFNQRTDCIYRKMREIVQSGKMGRIRRTNWIITNWYRPQAYYDSGAWRATWSGEGGGVLLNQCPHNLDLWQWICGMPKTVTAHLYYGKWHDIEVEDDVTAFVEYENGATGCFITTTGDAPGTNRFEITLDGGKLLAENGKLYMTELEMFEPEFSRTNKISFAGPRGNTFEVETDGQSPQHVGVLNRFAAAILRDEPLVARGEEGIFGLTISNAMHLSSWLGKTVEIPFDEDLFYDELMKRVATSRRKEPVAGTVADLSGTYNTGK
ncbi:MAG: Gfo/Idh/MocA family oxidoreductase [Clostridia bacterium]|jgi:predicted dehydrogenase|nr:Gfo/Idh/MocA family oxidoreductase [Clostridia bacterium]MBO7503203.1 Gfo/Idh/MocA family oxidoreductase [Clostridia bacterium]MBO7658130.1 Gfo/Idh/MocA family oxidoreductase [Clostridia bacterium]MBP5665165.1 Gfo/Idh/MocA family oxidoreductase [Clostridia bacterium]MBP5765960.1 Gfo/Idh/MocA family oxidoreductase [Clostridia bacterium]